MTRTTLDAAQSRRVQAAYRDGLARYASGEVGPVQQAPGGRLYRRADFTRPRSPRCAPASPPA